MWQKAKSICIVTDTSTFEMFVDANFTAERTSGSVYASILVPGYRDRELLSLHVLINAAI